MEQEIQPQQVSQNKKLPLVVAISVLLTALIVGAGIYFWQKSEFNKIQSGYEVEIQKLKNQISDLERKSAQQTTQEAIPDNTVTQGSVSNSIYTNNQYKFSFKIPDSWTLQKEEKDIGGDPFRVYLAAPDFVEEAVPNADYILSVSVTARTFDQEYKYLEWNVGKESEEKITVAGREAVKRIGRHEFGGYLVVVIVPNGNNAIELILRTNEKPYITQFEALLNSFKFTN